MDWIKYLDNEKPPRGWTPHWCNGPVRLDEDASCGVLTTIVLSSWSADREALQEVGDPIEARLVFITRIRASLEEGKLSEVKESEYLASKHCSASNSTDRIVRRGSKSGGVGKSIAAKTGC